MTRQNYLNRFSNRNDAMAFEHNLLGTANEWLPECAIEVKNDGKATPEYWAFLIEQIDISQGGFEPDYLDQVAP